jgi:hypothetical protein
MIPFKGFHKQACCSPSRWFCEIAGDVFTSQKGPYFVSLVEGLGPAFCWAFYKENDDNILIFHSFSVILIDWSFDVLRSMK